MYLFIFKIGNHIVELIEKKEIERDIKLPQKLQKNYYLKIWKR